MDSPSIGIVQPTPTDLGADELASVEKLQKGYHNLKAELGKVIVGQDAVIEELLIALFCRGHAAARGRAGLGQDAADLDAEQDARPELQPHPVHARPHAVGHHRHRGHRGRQDHRRPRAAVRAGPIFANVILADEINRTPPKTQAALLEAMQEHQVTAGGKQHRLPQPFFVLATQNPIEQEGTYPLPEAQLDRFMFNINVGYPSEEEEFQIVRLTTMNRKIDLQHILSGEEIIGLQEIVRKVPVADHVIRYALQLSRMTRVSEGGVPDFVKDFVGWGGRGPASTSCLRARPGRC